MPPSWTSLALAALVAAPALAQSVTPPAEHLGYPVGADFELPDWNQVSQYFVKLGEQSERVQVSRVGTTTEDRAFLLAVISDPENLAQLDALKAHAKRIADPRGLSPDERAALLTQAKPFVFVSCAMHATETAAPSFAMEFAYLLATSDAEPWASARKEAVILLAPSLNPDGLDHVVEWYRRTQGTPHEGASLTKLYQLYAGHDNNRDWFGLTLAETRIVTGLLYSEWFPQVYWDVHQQRGGRERFFLPPYRDPLNPNLDPAVVTAIDALGSRALFDMTREGLSGISTGVTYDMWWNGGNRSVPVRHNVIGILTEACSVNFASPVFRRPDELEAPRGLGGYAPSNRFPKPWPGGWWRLRDIVDYELSFGRSLLGSLAREPKTWLANSLEAAERALDVEGEAPAAWVIPSSTNHDRGAVRRLVDGLLLGGVEVFVADEPFRADERTWPAGSLIVPRRQPYGAHVKDLFELQRYPAGDPPYDVAGWTLPLLFGVHRVEVVREFGCAQTRIGSAEQATAKFPPAVAGDARDTASWAAAFKRLRAEEDVYFVDDEGPVALRPEGKDFKRLRLPRIGLYAPWFGSMDEGWLRWVFDTHGVPYVRVRNEMLRAGDLGAFLDVLIVPSLRGSDLDDGRAPGSVPGRFAGGLAPEGAIAVEEFVRQGGRLIALGDASEWAIELLELPLVDAIAAAAKEEQGRDTGFSCGGSVLRAVPTASAEINAGLPHSLALFFSNSAAWDLGEVPKDAPEPTVLLRYAPQRTLYSGWIRKPEVIQGKAAWVHSLAGKGDVHLFGFRPQYRGWSQATFQLLFRAILVPRSRVAPKG
ncbi:MAG: peptidase M14 [Planctomycetes bacterium]|nr:peptidase M14 [Planctomycetota bacterium]